MLQSSLFDRVHASTRTPRLAVAADLFSGLGGLTEGARRAGVRVVFAANHLPLAVRWHHANHPDTHHEQQDLAQMDMRILPDLSSGLLLAAPACQGFTQAGQPARSGTGGNSRPDAGTLKMKHQADRNSAWAILAAADTARPARILVENVPEFMRWELFGAWCDVLRAMGYAINARVHNASAFGSAQNRRRMLLTGTLDGPAIEIEPPAGVQARTIADCLDDDDQAGNRWTPIASKSDRMRPLIAKAQRGAGARCVWNNVSESSGRPLDGLFPTLTTKCGSQINLLDGERMRVLNPRELARAQSFPEDYELPANRNDAGFLIGNAIDVQLAASAIGQLAA